MKIGITLETNLDKMRNVWINDLSNSLHEHFKERNFGEDLKELLIGIIVIEPKYDSFFKVRKPRYQKGRKVFKNYEAEDSISYDLKLNYSNYKQYQKEEFMINLKKELSLSVQILKKIKGLKNFDFVSFNSELRNFLKVK